MNSKKDDCFIIAQANRLFIDEVKNQLRNMKKDLKIQHRINIKNVDSFKAINKTLSSLAENNSKLIVDFQKKAKPERMHNSALEKEKIQTWTSLPAENNAVRSSDESEGETFELDFTKHKSLLNEYRASLQEFKNQSRMIQDLVKNTGRSLDEESKLITKIEKAEDYSLSSCIFSSPDKTNDGENLVDKKKLPKDLLISDLIADFEKKRQKQKENMTKIEKNLEVFKRNKGPKNSKDEKREAKESLKENKERNGQSSAKINNEKDRALKKNERKVQKEISAIDAEIKTLVFKIKDAFNEDN